MHIARKTNKYKPCMQYVVIGAVANGCLRVKYVYLLLLACWSALGKERQTTVSFVTCHVSARLDHLVSQCLVSMKF